MADGSCHQGVYPFCMREATFRDFTRLPVTLSDRVDMLRWALPCQGSNLGFGGQNPVCCRLHHKELCVPGPRTRVGCYTRYRSPTIAPVVEWFVCHRLFGFYTRWLGLNEGTITTLARTLSPRRYWLSMRLVTQCRCRLAEGLGLGRPLPWCVNLPHHEH